jgi:hypothetical protein
LFIWNLSTSAILCMKNESRLTPCEHPCGPEFFSLAVVWYSGSHGGEYEDEHSGTYRRIISLMWIDVSKVHTVSIIRTIIHRVPLKRRSTSTTLHGAISQKAVIFGYDVDWI